MAIMRIDEMQDAQDRAANLWEKPQADWDRFYVDHPFDRKVYGAKQADFDPGDIETSGYASTWVKDRDDEYVDPGAFDDTIEHFLAKNPMMLWQHNIDWPLGIYKNAEVDQWGLRSNGLIRKVEDREPDWKHLAYHSVAKGIVRTHSIGGYFEREAARDKSAIVIKRVHLMEVSIVSIPSNPESIFEAAVKSIEGGSRRPKLTQKHIAQMTQILGAAEMTDPELLGMNEKQRRGRYAELAEYYARCGKRAPEYDEWDELVKEEATSEGLAGIRPVASKAIVFMQKVQGGVAPTAEDLEVKIGRTLSAKNEENIRKAIELLSEIVTGDSTGSTQEDLDGGQS